MKEMPKEIWLHHVTTPSIIGTTWLERKVWDNDVEYVHKDAFVEKACDAYCKTCRMPNCKGKGCKFIENFKNHMKGE